MFRGSDSVEGLIGPAANGVSDRSSHSNDAVIAEVGGIVEDVVVVNLWADKYVIPHVVAQAATNVYEEVVAATETGTKVEAACGVYQSVEARALPPDAAHEIGAELFAQLGLVHAVKVQNDGAERLAAGATVFSLAGFPGGLEVKAQTIVEDDIGAYIWVQAPGFGYEASKAVTWVARRRSYPDDRAKAEHGIALLCLGETGE